MIGLNELLPWKLSSEDLLIEDRIMIPPTYSMVKTNMTSVQLFSFYIHMQCKNCLDQTMH